MVFRKTAKKMFYKIKYLLLTILIVFVMVLMLFFQSCNSKKINFNTNQAIGKVSNTFGPPLNRDIDNDKDKDAAVVLNNIAGGNGDDKVYSMYLDSNGKIYITGNSFNGKNSDAYVLRLNNDGKIDNSFGTNLNRDINGDGVTDSAVVLDNIAGANGGDGGKSIYIDSNSNVYITGWSYSANEDMFVIKLNPDGSLVKTFGNKGKVVLNNIAGGNGNDTGNSIYVDNQEKIYVTGSSWNGSNYDMYVIKLNPDGSMDKTFGNQGKVVLDNIAGGKGNDFGKSIYLDSKGKIYVLGESYNGNNFDIYVLRLNKDGSLDRSFNNRGKIILDNIAGGNREDRANSIYVNSNGKIYIAGISSKKMINLFSSLYFTFVPCVLQLNINGNLNNSFGSNGKVILNDMAGIFGIGMIGKTNSIYVDNNGKIFITGYRLNFLDGIKQGYNTYVVRLNPDGSLDKTFGNKGKLIINNIAGGSKDDLGESMYVDKYGKIYVTGESSNGNNLDVYVIKIE